MRLFETIGAVAVAVVMAGGAWAATVNTISNVVFIVDESGSMGGEQAFLKDTVIDRLDADLAAAGVTNRSYGVVGYGNGQNPGNLGRAVGGASLGDAATTKTNLGGLLTSGSFEDGYSAIDFALSAYSYTPGAAINFILVTDEDRDNGNPALDFTNILSRLSASNILLNAVVDNGFESGAGATALGINNGGTAYVADGMGGFVEAPGGTADPGSTKDDYVDLALQSGGAAWDLNQLRAGGNPALSFASAFVDIKVSEIISQPPSNPNPIPVPAALPLLLGGLGALGAVRLRRKRAA